jgi:hypothetical protein
LLRTSSAGTRVDTEFVSGASLQWLDHDRHLDWMPKAKATAGLHPDFCGVGLTK